MNKIYIRFEETIANYKKKISSYKIKKWVRNLFKKFKIKNCSISIYFADNEIIKELNMKYLNNNNPTDVLSFSQLDEKENINKLKGKFLGDIVISLPYAEKSSIEKNNSLLLEVYFLILHGLLHILGYDHEKNDQMLEAQSQIFYELTGEKIVL